MQVLADPQETPNGKNPRMRTPLVRSTCHRPASQASVSGRVLAAVRKSKLPVAMQRAAIAQDTNPSSESGARFGVGVWITRQPPPFQVSASVWECGPRMALGVK